MSTNNATDYAARLADSIHNQNATGAPFGYVNRWDDTMTDELSEVHEAEGTDPDEWEDEHGTDELPGDWEVATAYDWLANDGALDIRYIVASDRTYRDAEICLSIGGPNVWIHTDDATLHVWWGFSHAAQSLPRAYVDALSAAAEEIWEMGA